MRFWQSFSKNTPILKWEKRDKKTAKRNFGFWQKPRVFPFFGCSKTLTKSVSCELSDLWPYSLDVPAAVNTGVYGIVPHPPKKEEKEEQEEKVEESPWIYLRFIALRKRSDATEQPYEIYDRVQSMEPGSKSKGTRSTILVEQLSLSNSEYKTYWHNGSYILEKGPSKGKTGLQHTPKKTASVQETVFIYYPKNRTKFLRKDRIQETEREMLEETMPVLKEMECEDLNERYKERAKTDTPAPRGFKGMLNRTKFYKGFNASGWKPHAATPLTAKEQEERDEEAKIVEWLSHLMLIFQQRWTLRSCSQHAAVVRFAFCNLIETSDVF